MHHQSPNTAVLVFIRDEREEAQLKSFRSQLSLRARMQVIRTLNCHVSTVTRQARLPTFVIKGAQQVGQTFGERFANAVESIFQAGYEQVIAVGNDCLSLNAGHLQKMAEQLANGTDLVIGPAKDGGAYAIGMQRNAFQRDLFLQLPWQTEYVFDALLHYAENLNANYYCLPPACDADDVRSFQQAISGLSSTTRLFRLLKYILHTPRIQLNSDIPFISNHLSFISLLRAPPAVC